jgi:hypothetical protein
MDDFSPHELRQYFEDLYITFLGSAQKNGHALNPDAILKDTETHFIALVARMKKIGNVDKQL